jgi:hypothetical protein
MADDNLISTDSGSGRVSAAQKIGFYYNWGTQAWPLEHLPA